MPNRKRKIEITSSPFPILLLRLGIVLLFYFISRLLFLAFNRQTLLPEMGEPFSYWLFLFLGALRFDLVSVFVVNTPFIIATLLPFRFRKNRIYRNVTEVVLFYIPNIIAFSTDYIDIIYSRFTQKRMTFDVVRFLETGNEFMALLPKFLIDFWYMFLIFMVMMSLFVFLNKLITVKDVCKNQTFTQFFIPNFLLFLLMLGISVIAIRGGFQLRPINIVKASQYAKPCHYSLVLNTPFTLIKTLGDESIQQHQYFETQELKKVYEPICKLDDTEAFKESNVFVIILEGIGSYYFSEFNPTLQKSFVPNLDSIAKSGISVSAYANGTRSMEGIPAILAGLPTWMGHEYLTSNYAENQITSLPSLLKQKGYTSAFFHGGKNGTMNFDSFTAIAGFDYYYGKNEYNNDSDFDGTWGIFDDKFLSYTALQLDTLSQPFFASVFLLSSHHPFSLPSDYLKQYPHKKPTMQESVSYSDWALGKFFQQISQKHWFENTLFVIVSDHATKTDSPLFNSPTGKYNIPLIFYHPTDSLPLINKPFAQQIDVLPSILDYLHYSDPFFSFGRSVFGTDSAFSISYLNGSFQLINSCHVIVFDGEQVTALYHRVKDPYLKNNLIPQYKASETEVNFLKVVIQTYNTSLINNQLTIKHYHER